MPKSVAVPIICLKTWNVLSPRWKTDAELWASIRGTAHFRTMFSAIRPCTREARLSKHWNRSAEAHTKTWDNSLSFRQSLIPLLVCVFKYNIERRKGLRAAYALKKKDPDRNNLPPRPFRFHIKAVFTFADKPSEMSEWRNGKNCKNQALCPLFHKELAEKQYLVINWVIPILTGMPSRTSNEIMIDLPTQ